LDGKAWFKNHACSSGVPKSQIDQINRHKKEVSNKNQMHRNGIDDGMEQKSSSTQLTEMKKRGKQCAMSS
jgi:3-methyladenine DNA glycosylase AlkD